MKFKIIGMDIKLFVPAFIILTMGVLFGVINKGLIYSVPLLLLFGFVLFEIGEKIPFWNKWLGGGTVLTMLVTSMVVKFYFIEAAIAAGLCMANMGVAGDIATLSAANRMSLMPFSLISSRIGGALMLVIAGILASLFL